MSKKKKRVDQPRVVAKIHYIPIYQVENGPLYANLNGDRVEFESLDLAYAYMGDWSFDDLRDVIETHIKRGEYLPTYLAKSWFAKRDKSYEITKLDEDLYQVKTKDADFKVAIKPTNNKYSERCLHFHEYDRHYEIIPFAAKLEAILIEVANKLPKMTYKVNLKGKRPKFTLKCAWGEVRFEDYDLPFSLENTQPFEDWLKSSASLIEQEYYEISHQKVLDAISICKNVTDRIVLKSIITLGDSALTRLHDYIKGSSVPISGGGSISAPWGNRYQLIEREQVEKSLAKFVRSEFLFCRNSRSSSYLTYTVYSLQKVMKEAPLKRRRKWAKTVKLSTIKVEDLTWAQIAKRLAPLDMELMGAYDDLVLRARHGIDEDDLKLLEAAKKANSKLGIKHAIRDLIDYGTYPDLPKGED